MRFITIFRSSQPPSGPPSAEHIAAVQAEIGKAVAAGVMHATGGIGRRAETGGRVTRKGDRFTVEAPPEGDGGWMAAGGFSILSADSREALIAQLKQQLMLMGEGTVEFCEYKQFYPPAESQTQAPTVAMKDGAAVTVPLPGVIPYFSVEGAAAASDFYAKAFGAKEVRRQPAQDGKRLMHCQMELNGGTIMFSDTFPEYGHAGVRNGYTMQLVLADGQAWWDRAIAAGCTVETPYELAFWGDTFGTMRDPFGVTWAISSPQA